MSGNVDVGAVLTIAEPLVLDVIAWFQRRSTEAGAPPTDQEVVAYMKGRLAAIVKEADAFEAEGSQPPA